MTTPLDKPVAREVTLGDHAYKIVIASTGVKVTPKHGRKGAELPWETIIALGQGNDRVPEPRHPEPSSDLPRPLAADIAKEVRAATDALSRARSVLARVGSLPAALLMEVDPDPVYGKRDEGTDWYIEPLLTPHEVASILRVSTTVAGRLGIPCVSVGGESRYRQSDLRRYLAAQAGRF